MKDKEKQIEEMPICVNCIHAYVCEEYNLNRDMLRKRCAYHNDHFLDIKELQKAKTIEEMAKADKDLMRLCKLLFENWDGTVITVAKTVLEHYQPKLPEDTIAISKEFYNEMVDDVKISKDKLVRIIDSSKEKASKETAEKILNFIEEKRNEYEMWYLLGELKKFFGIDLKNNWAFGDLAEEIAKQFGVEIKEN